MDISKTIAANLSAWMAATPELDTIQKVEAKSGVGFGTVRRARNGDGNITVEKLTAIAAAFRQPPAALLTPATERNGGALPPSPAIQTASNQPQSQVVPLSAWPFRRIDPARVLALPTEEQAFIEGQLLAAIHDAETRTGKPPVSDAQCG